MDNLGIVGIIIAFVLGSIITISAINAEEELVPSWIKNTASFWVYGDIADQEFLNAIQFLIENDILVLDEMEQEHNGQSVILPNGNSLQGNIGYYIPLNLEIKTGSTVVWHNDDVNVHTIQSQDSEGNPSGLFSSSLLQTGDTFEFTFTESGEYHYYCTLHPWRVGVITVK